MRRIFIILSLLFLLWPKPIAAQDQVPVILMMPFDNATGQQKFDSLKTGMPDLLTAFLTPYNEQLMVIDRGLIEQVFFEKSLRWEGFTEEKSLTQLGKLTQARYIIRGSISGKENSLGINALLYETETTRLLKSFEGNGRADDLNHLAQRIARQIAEYFKTDIKEMADLPLEKNPEKSVNFIYGLGYYHSGQSELALAHFMKILEDDPKDTLAHFWLGKSFLQAGMKGHAKIEFEQYLKMSPKGEKAGEIVNALKQIANEGEKVDEDSKKDE